MIDKNDGPPNEDLALMIGWRRERTGDGPVGHGMSWVDPNGLTYPDGCSSTDLRRPCPPHHVRELPDLTTWEGAGEVVAWAETNGYLWRVDSNRGTCYGRATSPSGGSGHSTDPSASVALVTAIHRAFLRTDP